MAQLVERPTRAPQTHLQRLRDQPATSLRRRPLLGHRTRASVGSQTQRESPRRRRRQGSAQSLQTVHQVEGTAALGRKTQGSEPAHNAQASLAVPPPAHPPRPAPKSDRKQLPQPAAPFVHIPVQLSDVGSRSLDPSFPCSLHFTPHTGNSWARHVWLAIHLGPSPRMPAPAAPNTTPSASSRFP